MFAVLQIEKGQEEGIFARFLHKMKKRTILTRTVQTKLGEYLLVTTYSEQINWDKVAQITGRAGRNLVLPRRIQLPQGCPVRRFEPDAFRLQVLLNTCVDVIRHTKLPLYRKIVTLVDQDGAYTQFVPDLLCYCMTVKVVTAAQERYGTLSEKMMEELGASIVVTDHMEGSDGSMLIIAPDAEQAVQVAQPVAVITAGDIDRPALCKLVGDLRIQPKGDLAACVPKEIDALDFAAAMCQLSGWHAGNRLAAGMLRCKNNQLTTTEFVGYLERSMNKKINNGLQGTKQA